jgi:protoporphyrinogen IX oxidase
MLDWFSIPWVKAFHIIAVVSWFAGLFYLPRFFVYHVNHISGPVHEQFCIMERKLYRFIMRPAMVLTVVLGLLLAAIEWDTVGGEPWFWIKMVLVAALLVFHWHNGRVVRAFAAGRNRYSERFFRLYNELPTLVLIGAVIMVVVRPF